MSETLMQGPGISEEIDGLPETDPSSDEAEITAEVAQDGDVVLQIRVKKFVAQALFEKASSVVPSKDILPVLKNFQVEARDGVLRVIATDLELSVISSAEMVLIDVEGVAVFPARKVLDIIREAKDEEMDITVRRSGEAMVATVEVGPTNWVLRLQSGDDYPPLPEIAEVELHEVDRVKFLGALSSVRYAASQETNRTSLMMINIDDGKMTACDGARFQQALIEGFPLPMQIPIGAVDDIVKLLRTTDLQDVGIGEAESHLVFRVGNDVFIANKLLATFPDVEDLLLRPVLGNRHKLLADHDDLVSAVKRVRINADPETSAIVLKLSTGQVEVCALDKFGNTSAEVIGAGWTESPREVVVSHKFLIDMLDMYDGRSCQFLLGDDTKSRKMPVLLRDPETGTQGVIQQMRADWTVG